MPLTCRRTFFLLVVAAGGIRLIFRKRFMTRQQVLDLYFLDARHKLVELAAFLDRVERAGGRDDFRMKAFRTALPRLNGKKKNKARRVLLAFSDPTTKPIPAATTKAAGGAWPGAK
jgi:hypothetical protein